jgi:D-2-hydroxyacid dehydrogenase (NADP+)
MNKVLVAVDGFTEQHMAQIEQSVADWGTCVRIAQDCAESTYREQLADANVAIGWPKAHWIAESNLEFLQLASVGYDDLLHKGLGAMPKLTVCNLKGVLVIPVAEQVLAAMYCMARGLHRHARDQIEKRWERLAAYQEITSSTVCIIGMGGIGCEVARRTRAVGMVVHGVARSPEKIPPQLVDTAFGWTEMPQALSTADHVVLCFPATPEYHHMFDQDMFACMKKGAYFYNVGRGSVVDETALLKTLSSSHLAGAALDVFQEEPLPSDHPLWNRPDVLVTPHSAGRSVNEFRRICDLFTNNIERLRCGESLLNQITL